MTDKVINRPSVLFPLSSGAVFEGDMKEKKNNLLVWREIRLGTSQSINCRLIGPWKPSKQTSGS